MKRLWVIMSYFKSDGKSDGKWDICDFAGRNYCFTNFYDAHDGKREIQKYLKECGNKSWYKNRFRVVEFNPKNKKGLL